MTDWYMGFDLGGMSAKAGLFDQKGQCLYKCTAATSKDDGYVTVVTKLYQLAKETLAAAGASLERLKGVGLASPGVIDGNGGVVIRWSNYGWTDKPIGRDLAQRLSAPVRLVNDANAAALGEAKFGASKKYTDSVFLTLGTGVGSGIISGGKLMENCGGAEAGHMVIEAGGVPCPCGRRGCFEQYASATALIRDTKKAMFEHKDSVMWELVDGDPDKVDGRTAFSAAKADDPAGAKVVKNYISYLGEGLANLVNLLRPQAVIIGGGICNEGEYLLQPLRRWVGERIYVDGETIPLVIARAKLGNDAGIYGAAALAMGR